MPSKVAFRCPACKVQSIIAVPERLIALDIKLYLDVVVMPRVAIAHKEMSPECHEPTVDLAIPVEQDKLVGQEVSREINEAEVNLDSLFASTEKRDAPMSDCDKPFIPPIRDTEH